MSARREQSGRVSVYLLAFGVTEHTRMLGEALAGQVRVILALPQGSAERSLVPGVETRFFAVPRLRHPIGQARLCASLRRDVHRAAPDIVHLQQGHLWFNAVLPTVRTPLALTVHDHRHHIGDVMSRKTPQWMMDFGFRQAARLMVHGAYVKEGLIEDCGIAEHIVDVLPPPLTEPLPDSFGFPPADPPTILFFGRMWRYKGLEELLRAQPLVSRHRPDARFVVAGQGESLDNCQQQMADAGCFHVINRWVGNRERSDLFRNATVVVLPYIEATQSGVVPVAYGHARPVVATRVGSLPEVVHDGQTGLLVPPCDERALAAALIRVIDSRPLQRLLSTGARQFAERELTPERMAEATLMSYDRLLTGCR